MSLLLRKRKVYLYPFARGSFARARLCGFLRSTFWCALCCRLLSLFLCPFLLLSSCTRCAVRVPGYLGWAYGFIIRIKWDGSLSVITTLGNLASQDWIGDDESKCPCIETPMPNRGGLHTNRHGVPHTNPDTPVKLSNDLYRSAHML